MRLAVVLLLVVNVAVAVWGAWLREPVRLSAPSAPGGDLVLLREDAGARGGCATLAPALPRARARRLVEDLRPRVKRARLVRETAPSGYRVYLAPRETLAQAREVLAVLHRQGFVEARLATGTGKAKTILAGRFQEKAPAQAQRNALAAQGYSPRLRAPATRPAFRVAIQAAALPAAPNGHGWRGIDCGAVD